jgi:hypothetical protein
MKRTITTIAASLTLALGLAACGTTTNHPLTQPSPTTNSQTTQPVDASACKLAMAKQFQEAMNSGKTGTRPQECNGIDDATVQKYAEEILGKAFDDETAK